MVTSQGCLPWAGDEFRLPYLFRMMDNPHPELGILELKLWVSVGDAFYKVGAVHLRGLGGDVFMYEATNSTPAWMPFESRASSVDASALKQFVEVAVGAAAFLQPPVKLLVPVVGTA